MQCLRIAATRARQPVICVLQSMDLTSLLAHLPVSFCAHVQQAEQMELIDVSMFALQTLAESTQANNDVRVYA
jgi:hypothetical protein